MTKPNKKNFNILYNYTEIKSLLNMQLTTVNLIAILEKKVHLLNEKTYNLLGYFC